MQSPFLANRLSNQLSRNFLTPSLLRSPQSTVLGSTLPARVKRSAKPPPRRAAVPAHGQRTHWPPAPLSPSLEKSWKGLDLLKAVRSPSGTCYRRQGMGAIGRTVLDSARACSRDRRGASFIRAAGCGVDRVIVGSDRLGEDGFLQLVICGDCLRDGALRVGELYKARWSCRR